MGVCTPPAELPPPPPPPPLPPELSPLPSDSPSSVSEPPSPPVPSPPPPPPPPRPSAPGSGLGVSGWEPSGGLSRASYLWDRLPWEPPVNRELPSRVEASSRSEELGEVATAGLEPRTAPTAAAAAAAAAVVVVVVVVDDDDGGGDGVSAVSLARVEFGGL